MSQSLPLAEAFCESLPSNLRGRFALDAALQEALAGLVDKARAAWPAIDVEGTLFVGHLAERLTADTQLATVLAADLYLAFACALGDPVAMAAMETSVLKQVPNVLRGNLPAGLSHDDVMQTLRVKLFLRQAEAPPAIVTYSGRGPLLHWLRAAALRVTQDFARVRKLEIAIPDEAMLDMPAIEEDADVRYLKTRYAPEFKAAFQEALVGLPPRDQNMLRLQYLDGMSPDEIGRIYQTHRTTVWRWLTQCRQELLKRTRKVLAEKLQLSDSELSSLMTAVQSELDVSLSRLLRKP